MDIARGLPHGSSEGPQRFSAAPEMLIEGSRWTVISPG